MEKGRLAVECPPEITKHLMDIEVGETETAKLEVNFIGNPKPEIIWTRDGEELVNSRHVQIRERENRTTLQLINLSTAMAGEYRLVVVSRDSVVTIASVTLLLLRRSPTSGLTSPSATCPCCRCTGRRGRSST